MEGVQAIRSADLNEYRAWLSGVYQSGGIDRILSMFLRNFTRGDGLAIQGGAGDEDVALLFSDEFVSVHMRLLAHELQGAGQERVISSSPLSSLIMPFAGKAIDFTRYLIVGATNMDTFSRDSVIRPVAHGRCHAGDILDVQTGPVCMDLRANEGGVFALQVSSTASHRLIWDFDARTLAAAAVRSASVDASRDQLACKTLAAMSCGQAESVLCQVASGHDYHFVRMQAIRSLYEMNSEAVIGIMIERSRMDQHEHVRAACSRNLMNMGVVCD